MIGKKISPILEEIEDTLWEFEAAQIGPPKYPINGFRAAIKIFVSALLDKIWELQQNENLELEDRSNMAQKAGEEIRALVKTYTNIDCHELYSRSSDKGNA